ncbi:MAG: class I SAM-dependent methyltransferase [Candidatus Omnitrophica bacterium]|nr:class I SAM-dependent methyltransferase [Candidatus Omnitrophota bacterium]
MHPINTFLSLLGVRLSRIGKEVSPAFKREYEQNYQKLKQNESRFQVFKEFYYDSGEHPMSHIDFECAFASRHLKRSNPSMILDVGSYRAFILGLLANYSITTIDIRERLPVVENEIIINCDAKSLQLPDASVDAVVSLCALEHFGLGRYGDTFDFEGDRKAFKEMIRVLKPGGILIFSTTITRAMPSIVFNAHRIYNYDMIQTFCNGLTPVEENFYSCSLNNLCSLEQITKKSLQWDVYLGCWKKQ